MTTITTSKGQFLFVPVETGIWNIDLHQNDEDGAWIDYYTKGNLSGGEIDLMGWDYEIINTTELITEEEVAKIVDDDSMDYDGEQIDGYASYSGSQNEFKIFRDAKPSFESLIESHNLNGNYIVLKIIS